MMTVYAEFLYAAVIMVSIFMPSVFMLSVFMLSVFMLSVFMLSVFMLSVFLLLSLWWVSLCWVSLCWLPWFWMYYSECVYPLRQKKIFFTIFLSPCDSGDIRTLDLIVESNSVPLCCPNEIYMRNNLMIGKQLKKYV